MKYTLHPGDASDSAEMNAIYLDAFELNAIRTTLWPNVPREERLASTMRQYFAGAADGSRLVKAVEPETGCV